MCKEAKMAEWARPSNRRIEIFVRLRKLKGDGNPKQISPSSRQRDGGGGALIMVGVLDHDRNQGRVGE